MSNGTINDVRSLLLDTLRDLRDPKAGMDLDRARAIVQVGQVLIDSARAEVDAIKVLGGSRGSDFIAVDNGLPQLPGAGGVRQPVRN